MGRAFTLVEVTVAMAVSLLLVFVLLKVFTTATNSWQRGEAQVDAYREARGALQFMARDLSTIVQPTVVKADGTSTYARPLLPTLALCRYPNPETAEENFNEEIYCLTNTVNNSTQSTATPAPGVSPAPGPGMPSETCAVGYFCQWMPAIAEPSQKSHAPAAFALMRQFLNSDGVYRRIKQARNPNNTSASDSPLDFKDLYTRNSLLPGTTPVIDPPTAASTQLAAYIWDLKLRIDTNLADTSSDGTAKAPPPTDHSTPVRAYDGVSRPYPGVLPPYVEIRFKALSTTAGRRLEGDVNIKSSDWTNYNSTIYRQIILPSARQFVLRVPLLSSNPLPNP